MKKRKAVRSKQDKARLQQFQKMVVVGQKVNKDEIAQALGLPTGEFLQKLSEWKECIPFDVDEDAVVVDDLNAFSKAIDELLKD
jgi:DNA-directed RNA polymerase specialized sigma subunit